MTYRWGKYTHTHTHTHTHTPTYSHIHKHTNKQYVEDVSETNQAIAKGRSPGRLERRRRRAVRVRQREAEMKAVRADRKQMAKVCWFH